jgi:nitroreductase
MRVSQAVDHRRSIRAFRPEPLSRELVRDLLERAGRAPSGGNLQPWLVYALTGRPLRELLDLVRINGPDQLPGYRIYPANLWEPYRTRRFEVGEALYATIPVQRDDKPGRLRQLAQNGEFFGAPVGIYVAIDRRMGPPQWADLGMYLQTLMLLALEAGLDTCPQEFWTTHAVTVERFLGVREEHQLFCGLALGYRDEAAPINTLRTRRAPFDAWAQMLGF